MNLREENPQKFSLSHLYMAPKSVHIIISMLTEIDVEVVLGVLGGLLRERVEGLVVQVRQVPHRRAPVLTRGRILGRGGGWSLRVVGLVVGVPSSSIKVVCRVRAFIHDIHNRFMT